MKRQEIWCFQGPKVCLLDRCFLRLPVQVVLICWQTLDLLMPTIAATVKITDDGSDAVHVQVCDEVCAPS